MSIFEGEIVKPFGRDPDTLFAWLLWVEAFPRWFTLCSAAELVEGEAEGEGSLYRVSVVLGGVLRKTTLMRIEDLDEEARSYSFVRAEPGNLVEMRFAASPAAAGTSTITFAARYEGTGRILGIPVGGNAFTRVIERALDRSLPRLERLIAAEEG